ncbi:MAG TPA: sensor histidine kinase [Terracidiphilus sp.]|nr:sensor histidine kinase [Terracidiphilus sp.]
MHHTEMAEALEGAELKTPESMIPTLTTVANDCETLAEVAHDARNMVTALGLYCDLIEVPGVLATPFQHYGSELKIVAAASRRLVDKLMALDNPSGASSGNQTNRTAEADTTGLTAEFQNLPLCGPMDSVPVKLVDNLAAELKSNRNLLSAVAGPMIIVTVDMVGGALPVKLHGEDLTRILVNLVRNSTEAMPEGGRIHITLLEDVPAPGTELWLTLNIEDNGPGIPNEALENIFEPGFTTRTRSDDANGTGSWRRDHRGLGLSIIRSIVEAAGGFIHAANRDPSGACFQIELPVRVS